MSDIYSNPNGNPTDNPSEIATTTSQGSLERGIAGDYQFSIGQVLSEAWAKTQGAKLTINLALGIYFLVIIGIMVAMGIVVGMNTVFGNSGGVGQNISSGVFIQFGLQLVMMAVMGPMGGGLFMIGLRRSIDAPISAGAVLNYFHKIVPIVAMTIIMYILITIGFILLIIPGIYLSVAYYLALPLIVEKNLGPWQALEASRKAISKRWFAVFGLFLVLGLLNFLTVFTLFIASIWTIPMSVIAFGILYRNIFGIEAGQSAN